MEEGGVALVALYIDLPAQYIRYMFCTLVLTLCDYLLQISYDVK